MFERALLAHQLLSAQMALAVESTRTEKKNRIPSGGTVENMSIAVSILRTLSSNMKTSDNGCSTHQRPCFIISKFINAFTMQEK